ncbi:7402_t:CDS:1, partial [Paraglomus occultum]
LLDEFTYLIDTPYDNTDPNAWRCVVDRPPGGSVSSISLININHFLNKMIGTIGLPDPVDAANTNGANLVQHLQQCKTAFGRIANFISVDFSTKGDVFGAVAALNGLPPKRKVKTKRHR